MGVLTDVNIVCAVTNFGMGVFCARHRKLVQPRVWKSLVALCGAAMSMNVAAVWLQIMAVGMVMIVEPASAQSVTAFTTWALGPTMLGGLIGLFLALVGILLMAGQHTWTGIAFAIVGALLIGNAVQIAGFFGTGGGAVGG